MGMIGQLIATISQFVPLWVLAGAGAVILVLSAPGYLVGMKVKRVKFLLRKTVRAEDAERHRLQEEAYALAEHHGDVLIALVKEADKLNQPRLRDRALKRLRKLGTHPDEVRKLAAPADPREDKRFGHPLEAAATIKGLLQEEAWEAARARLAEARARFPDDLGLQELERQLPEALKG